MPPADRGQPRWRAGEPAVAHCRDGAARNGRVHHRTVGAPLAPTSVGDTVSCACIQHLRPFILTRPTIRSLSEPRLLQSPHACRTEQSPMKGGAGTTPLNVFEVHEMTVGDYQEYIRSFITIADDRIRTKVEESLDSGRLWPPPLLQFNPAYEKVPGAEEWSSESEVHPEVPAIFSGYSLYRHQVEALRLGVQGRDFIVTSGTGSGKSLTYMGSIFNHLLQHPQEEGIQAVVIYPMNALINSQTLELGLYVRNYEQRTGKEFPIRHGQYTGQEPEEKRRDMRERPPHILLTNYMMLELLLTRPQERNIRDAIYESLRFLVLDELHTYRGRQGADVSMLVRRVRAQCKEDVCCIGTSATMASVGSVAEKAKTVANVAGELFGREFLPDQVIDETLTRSLGSGNAPASADQLRRAIREPIDPEAGVETLTRHPVAVWLEGNIALEDQEGRLVRGAPREVWQIAEELAEVSGLEIDECKDHLINLLIWINKANNLGGGGGSSYSPVPVAPVRRTDRIGLCHTRPG